MDERVRELLERVRETAVTAGQVAGTTARYAGRYAGQMVDIAKLNMRIFDLKAEIAEDLKAVGQLVYDTHRGQTPDHAPMDTLLHSVDDAYAAIDEVKERIAVLKNSRTCVVCSAACGRDDSYCKDCGAAL